MAFNQYVALSVFKTVAEQQSFSRAAAALGLSASAVSQTIRQLEAELGTRLFQRTTRSVSLTEAGQLLWVSITPLLADMAAALERVKASPQSLKGPLKLSMPYIVWQVLVCPMLPTFTAAYPDIALSIEIDDGLVDIASQGFDAGIRLAQRLQQDMVAVPLALDFEAQLVASPGYVAQFGLPIRPQDLAQHRCIGYRFHVQGKVHEWQLSERMPAADGQPPYVCLPNTLVVNEERALVEAVQTGLGIAELFCLGVEAALTQGTLVAVLPQWRSPSHRFCLYYPSRHYLSLRLQAFIEALKQQAASMA